MAKIKIKLPTAATPAFMLVVFLPFSFVLIFAKPRVDECLKLTNICKGASTLISKKVKEPTQINTKQI